MYERQDGLVMIQGTTAVMVNKVGKLFLKDSSTFVTYPVSHIKSPIS